jgi:hypothetical protein
MSYLAEASPRSAISEGNTKRVIDFYEGDEIDALGRIQRVSVTAL